MAHGYAKVDGKPMLVLLHGVIGIQHGSMAIYNAYCDRVPIFMIAGVDVEGAVPAHNATDMAALARGYVKWDYQPDNLAQFTNGMFRAYKLMMTPPMAPGAARRRQPDSEGSAHAAAAIPKLVMPSPPAADLGVGARDREDARGRRESAGPGRPCRAHARRACGRWWSSPSCCRCRSTSAAIASTSRRATRLAATARAAPICVLMLEAAGGGGGERAVQAARRPAASASARRRCWRRPNYNVLGNPGAGRPGRRRDPEATLPALIEEVKKLVTAGSARVLRAAREAARGGESSGAAAVHRPGAIRLGLEPHQSPRVSPRSCGRSSRTRTGRSCRRRLSSAAGRCGCGT